MSSMEQITNVYNASVTTYGPNDHYDLKNSHFFPALIKESYMSAKSKIKNSFDVWGAVENHMRELIYVDDVAD